MEFRTALNFVLNARISLVLFVFDQLRAAPTDIIIIIIAIRSGPIVEKKEQSTGRSVFKSVFNLDHRKTYRGGAPPKLSSSQSTHSICVLTDRES